MCVLGAVARLLLSEKHKCNVVIGQKSRCGHRACVDLLLNGS